MTQTQISEAESQKRPTPLLEMAALLFILGLLDVSGAVLDWVTVHNPNAPSLIPQDLLHAFAVTGVSSFVVGLLFLSSGIFLYLRKYLSLTFFVLGVLIHIAVSLFAFGGKNLGILSLLLDAFILYQIILFKKKGWIA